MSKLIIASSNPINGEMIIFRDTTFDPVLTWKDKNGPIQWYGMHGTCELLLGQEPVLQVLQLMLGDTDGTMKFYISKEDTALITADKGFFKVFIIDSFQSRKLLIRGTVRVES